MIHEDFTGNEMLAKESAALLEFTKTPSYMILAYDSDEPPLLTSIKQINDTANRILAEWSDDPQLTPKLWSFREILSWKIPTHLLSTAARESQQKLHQK